MSKSLAERFWAKVNKAGPTQPHMTTPCWVWTGAIGTHGYGAIGVGSKTDGTRTVDTAHRVGFLLQGGTLTPEKPCALHRCDFKPCVRCDHLFAGTPAQNASDRNQKGRTASGEDAGPAKLTNRQVRVIRLLSAYGHLQREIGKRFGVARSNVSMIVNRKTYLGA